MSDSGEITALLRAWRDGDADAFEELIPRVYPELRRIAAMRLRRERNHHTLQATALIHEAYLKLVDQRETIWEGRTQFFALASSFMRRILVDHARGKKRKKRGGDDTTLQLMEEIAPSPKTRSVDLLALDEALERLKLIDERQVKVIELRFFGGLTLDEVAEALDCSRTTVATDWRMAKAWINRELTR